MDILVYWERHLCFTIKLHGKENVDSRAVSRTQQIWTLITFFYSSNEQNQIFKIILIAKINDVDYLPLKSDLR